MLTRVTSIDGRVATSTSGLETTRLTLVDLARRLGQLDDSILEVSLQSPAGTRRTSTPNRAQGEHAEPIK